jgi:hypothetical protein
VNDNDYDFFYNGCESRIYEEVLNLAVQPQKGDDRPLLNFIITNGSSRLMINFSGVDAPKHCKDLEQLLDFIKDWLLNEEVN